MKTKSVIIILILVCSISLKSQTMEKTTGFSDMKFSYIISSMSAGGNHFEINETMIPIGIGWEMTYNLSKRFSTNIGIEFRTTGKRILDSFVISEWGYSGPIHNEYRDIYLDIPFHINYKILNTRPFKVHLSSGPKETFYFYNNYYNPGYDGKEHRLKGTTSSTGLDFGLIETLKIFKQFGIFSSQYYGYYLFGHFSELESVDLKVGLTYNFK
ncbi:MAG: hypothetical protein EHM47_14605 [Ignavibacteriales bacterium]|nr:MAG: hypothetical protein EHM47_14605 [Ignavibacteriales bacterium]